MDCAVVAVGVRHLPEAGLAAFGGSGNHLTSWKPRMM
jgi:hypothetical protein